ncbi:acetyl ornithine aminotransferase family protein [Candidatus Viridilinea mediisalina]|uniref:(S)-3-amino-2-methylpropionate transaminase n=1 Tax=Candidatus Viridilinea mediisalina TaxID=2024553 RepID=A0A2A6RH41_9CHLR|nr:acetyl ornithine aminotransferase family protein [Candidatus Viridilinea mediisalina]PDW02387.1 aspartate aminotransferase family protein [Candidatus Viridilinea mediisalina]
MPTPPETIYGSAYMPTDVPGPQARALVERDAQVLAPVGRVYPLVVERALGCEVWDVDGQRYLDMNAGIAVLAAGHCHPRLVEVATAQLNRFTHMAGTDFYNEPMVRAAEKLVSLMPGGQDWQVFFTNSGTEAVEACVKLARYVTGRQNIIGFYRAFHGRSYGSLALTASKPRQREGFFPMLPGSFHALYPNCGHCPINLHHPECGLACLDFIEQTLFTCTTPPSEVAAIIIEPIQGEGGYVVPPLGTLAKLRELCDRHGILLICDEVQSGVGRTGKLWAFEHEGIVPDIVASAKGLGGGLPLGAMLARRALASQWKPGAHGNTYGGNGLTCAVTYELLCMVEEELMANAARVGAHLLAQLSALQQRFPVIGAVRGRGLMLGVELIDPASGAPASELANRLMVEAFRKGLLILTCGTSTIRFCPPLILTQAQADEAVERFALALEALC